MEPLVLWLLAVTAALGSPALGSSDTGGPVFIQEPPNNVDFSNTTGNHFQVLLDAVSTLTSL
jgi:hypothetical protein